MRRLLCLGVRTLQAIAVVLATVGHSECLALKLPATYDLRLPITDELRATARFLNRVLATDQLLLFPTGGSIINPMMHRRSRGVGFRPRSIALLQVIALTMVDYASRIDHRLTLLRLLLLEQLGHQLIVLVGILILIGGHVSDHLLLLLLSLLPSGLHLLHLLLPYQLLLLHLLHVLLLLLLLMLVLAGHGQTAIVAAGASFETGGLPDLALSRLARRRDVGLRHADHGGQLPRRLLVQLASRAERV